MMDHEDQIHQDMKHIQDVYRSKPGTQIAYIPSHAKGDINHPDVEFGFIQYTTTDGAFCRYWNKNFMLGLRTTANSELTPFRNLALCDSHPQFEVDYLIEKINAGIDLSE
jgi:hypothetical protein